MIVFTPGGVGLTADLPGATIWSPLQGCAGRKGSVPDGPRLQTRETRVNGSKPARRTAGGVNPIVNLEAGR